MYMFGTDLPLWIVFLICIVVAFIAWKLVKFALKIFLFLVIFFIILFAIDFFNIIDIIQNFISNIT